MRRRDSSSEGRRRASTFFRRGAKAVARVMTTEHEICSVAQQAHGRRRACVHPSDVPPIDAAKSRRAPRAYRILYAPTRVRNERRSRTRGPETGGAVSRGWHTCKKAKKTEGAEHARCTARHSHNTSVCNALARLTPVAKRAAPTGPSRARAARGPATPVTADGVYRWSRPTKVRSRTHYAKKANSKA